MCNPFHRVTPWEISTLLSALISISLILRGIITKLQHLLIGSYFNTCTDASILYQIRRKMCFLTFVKVGVSPCAKKYQINLVKLYTHLHPAHREVFTSFWECTVEGEVDHLLISSSCSFSSGGCVYVCRTTSLSEPGVVVINNSGCY